MSRLFACSSHSAAATVQLSKSIQTDEPAGRLLQHSNTSWSGTCAVGQGFRDNQPLETKPGLDPGPVNCLAIMMRYVCMNQSGVKKVRTQPNWLSHALCAVRIFSAPGSIFARLELVLNCDVQRAVMHGRALESDIAVQHG